MAPASWTWSLLPHALQMMASDRAPGNSALDSVIAAEMRAVLARSVENGNHGQELRALLARASADARSRGIQAEQLLIALKDIWYSLPQLASISNNEVQTRLLQQLIAQSIQEYYAS